MNRPRFLLDEDLSPRVAKIARGLGLDVESVHDIGRRGLSDADQLQYASSQERILVTRNRDDFIQLTLEAFRFGQPHSGVLIVSRGLPNRRPTAMARALQRWQAQRAGSGSLEYFIDFLGKA